jgi:hypothetical protein
MKVVYVAAPFRGPHAWAIESNVRIAEQAGFEVAKLGAMPLIPHTNTRFFHGALSDQFWLDGTLALMYKCDAVLFTGDWEKSSGCREEHRQCQLRGIPIFYSLDDLQVWLGLSSGE